MALKVILLTLVFLMMSVGFSLAEGIEKPSKPESPSKPDKPSGPEKPSKPTEPEKPSKPEVKETPMNLQQLADQIVKESGTPGLVLLTRDPDGTVEIATSGMADMAKNIPVDKDTQFFIGSISKNMVAVLIFQLQEQGLLSLEDPLKKYIDWPRGDEVTIRMLLNHSSGIPDYLSEYIYAQPKEKIIEFFSRERSQAEAIEPVKKMDFKFDPGTKQEYSNTNGILAGMVVMKVTGKPLGDVLDERIFKPLKMEHTYLYGIKTRDYPHARGYCPPEIWTTPLYNGLVDCTHADENIVDAADGSIVSTAGDLLTYHMALREGKLFTKGSWDQMTSKTPGFENGLGYILVDAPFGKLQGMMGRMNGFNAGMIYLIDQDTYFVALSNSGSGGSELHQLIGWKLAR